MKEKVKQNFCFFFGGKAALLVDRKIPKAACVQKHVGRNISQ